MMDESNFFNTISSPEARTLEQMANYEGDWTTLLKERLLDPEIKRQFISKREQYMTSLTPENATMMALPYIDEKMKEQIVVAQKHLIEDNYRRQIEKYDENLEHVFSITNIGPAARSGKTPAILGTNDYGGQGTVFNDAKQATFEEDLLGIEGKPLSVRQKNIIEAHEKGHGVREYLGQDRTEISGAIDEKTFPTPELKKYMMEPTEIIERMSQLKNYFSFKGSEKFTKEHLAYAREHYVADTGLDNRMTWFFKAITPETEEKFIEVINSYGV